MNKSMILVWIVIIFLILIAIGTGLFFWKRNKDISDMKTQLYNMGKNMEKNKSCKDLKSMTDCIVDNMVKNFGYLHAKELFDGDKPYTDQETKLQIKFTTPCQSKFCGT